MTTATETKSKTFTSKAKTLTLTLSPARRMKNAEGDVFRELPGVRVEFEDHRATIEEDQYGQVLVNGRRIEAEVTDVDGSTGPVTYEWIVDRLVGNTEKQIPPHLCLNRGVEHNAFYLDEPAPEPEPKLSDQLSAITRAAVNRDVDTIEAVLSLERETHSRDAVLIQGQAALEQIAEENE
jgi:hypothetical protein